MPFETQASRALLDPSHPVRATVVALVDGQAQVRVPGDTRVLAAESVIELSEADLGETVILGFIGGQVDDPVILGRTRRPRREATSPPVEFELDGHHVQLSAKRELSLRCGSASITMTADGRVTIKGRQITSQATGAHRIRGGTIKLN